MSDIPDDIIQAAYDCARGIYLSVDDAYTPYLTDDDIEVIAKAIFHERQRHAEVIEEVRKSALEEAAKIAERCGRNNEDDWPGETWIAEVIAKEIRALLSRLEER